MDIENMKVDQEKGCVNRRIWHPKKNKYVHHSFWLLPDGRLAVLPAYQDGYGKMFCWFGVKHNPYGHAIVMGNSQKKKKMYFLYNKLYANRQEWEQAVSDIYWPHQVDPDQSDSDACRLVPKVDSKRKEKRIEEKEDIASLLPSFSENALLEQTCAYVNS